MDFKSLMLFLGRFTASSIRCRVRLKPTRVGSCLACTIDIVSSGWVVSRFSMVRAYSTEKCCVVCWPNARKSPVASTEPVTICTGPEYSRDERKSLRARTATPVSKPELPNCKVQFRNWRGCSVTARFSLSCRVVLNRVSLPLFLSFYYYHQ
jgi:hypothetical protein